MYSSLIVFVIPGFLMFVRAWPLFTIPLAALIVFKRLIVHEEKFLATQFGKDYAKYKSKVNAILPVPRIWL